MDAAVKIVVLEFGDNNTIFFHAYASMSKKRNEVHRLQKEDGVWVDKDNGMFEHMVEYFINIFSTAGTDMETILTGVDDSILDDQNIILVAQVTEVNVVRSCV